MLQLDRRAGAPDQPVTGVALSALALGEVLSPWALVGGALVLAGVGIASREP